MVFTASASAGARSAAPNATASTRWRAAVINSMLQKMRLVDARGPGWVATRVRPAARALATCLAVTSGTVRREGAMHREVKGEERRGGRLESAVNERAIYDWRAVSRACTASGPLAHDVTKVYGYMAFTYLAF